MGLPLTWACPGSTGGYFDPLGLTSGGDEARTFKLKEAELKHGRLAMVAFLGESRLAACCTPASQSSQDPTGAKALSAVLGKSSPPRPNAWKHAQQRRALRQLLLWLLSRRLWRAGAQHRRGRPRLPGQVRQLLCARAR